MNCACTSALHSNASSYERLSEIPLLSTSGSGGNGSGSEKVDLTNEKEMELAFYNDDGSFKTVVVEKDLCAGDLCHLLALKNRVNKDINWAIVEHWVDQGLERSLEDHETVLSVYGEMESCGRQQRKRFIFRKDFRKYEFFHSPQQFFPADMIDLSGYDDIVGLDTSSSLARNVALQSVLNTCEELPPVFGYLWMRESNKQVWRKAFFLLKDKSIYYSHKVQVISKYLRSWKATRENNNSSKNNLDNGCQNNDLNSSQLQLFANVNDFVFYSTLNAKNQFRAPTEFGICCRQTDPDQNNLDGDDLTSACELVLPGSASGGCGGGDNSKDGSAGAGVDGGVTMKCLSCEDDQSRRCWMTALRLAKYGRQLRENYFSLKLKTNHSSNSNSGSEHGSGVSPTAISKEYSSFQVPNESVRSRVAMDFTGKVGRIIDDPREAKVVAVAEGYSWKRRIRPTMRPGSPGSAPHSLPLPTGLGLDMGIHVTQPWFHSGMSREIAARLLTKHGTVDGIFLVRESRSHPGAFVLSFACNGKVFHTQIIIVMDPVREVVCYSLDQGRTRFYDLLQLVEFYQLNQCCLPCRLTYYIIQSGSPAGVRSGSAGGPSGGGHHNHSAYMGMGSSSFSDSRSVPGSF